MGYSLSWIAVKGRTSEEVCRLLGVTATGKHGQYGEHPLVGRRLWDDWYILIANECDDRIIRTKTLARFSSGGDVVACSIEEHVMHSSCAFWHKGRKVWSVAHRGERGVFDITKSGRLPQNFSLLKDEFLSKQRSAGGDNADVDHLFDLPLELARECTGFKHDEATCGSDDTYEILETGVLQKLSRTLSAWTPWLAVIGILLLFGIIMGFVGSLIVWVIKFIKSVAAG